ncbi:MAG: DUF2306 domain-containing protein [Rhodospirillaceae bacterium]
MGWQGSWQRIAFWLMAATSLTVAVVSYRFLALGFAGAFAPQPIFAAFLAHQPLLFKAHVIAAPVALFLGVLQFLPKIRARWPALHRWSGRASVLAILIGGFAGLGLAMVMGPERPIAGLGFGALSTLWILTAALGVQAIRRGDVSAHRQWMTYGFALTFSAVTFRLHLLAAFAMGVEYPSASAVIAWSCWLPNLVVAWWLLRRPTA